MTFLHLQLALAGLACVGIPILIHLLMRRRRKPVMWGAMRFLLEAYRKQKRRLLIEKWLLLATRCLLVLLLALAIGRPLVGALIGAGAGRTVYVLLDNGLAAGLTGPDAVVALERHKDAAQKVLSALQGIGGEGDRAALVTLAGPAEGLVLPVSADVPAVATLLDSVQSAHSRTDLPGALSLVAAAIESDRTANNPGARRGQTFVIILSDLLEGSADLTSSLAKLPDGVRILASAPLSDASSNIAITGVEPLRSVVVTGKTPDAPEATAGDSIGVTLRRSGPGVARAGSSTVVLHMASVRDRGESAPLSEVARVSIPWKAGEETTTASLQAVRRAAPASGADRAGPGGTLTEIIEVHLEGTSNAENAVPGDDTWRRPVEVRDALRVGIVSPRRFGARDRVDRLDAGEWLRLALRPGDNAPVEITELEPALLDGARLAGLDAVALTRPDLLTAEHWPRLRLFLDNGGMLLVMPPPGVQVHLWPDAMVKELGLNWQIAREAKSYGGEGAPPAAIAPVPQASTHPDNLLSLIHSEINDLAKPVSIWKSLPIQLDSADGRILLSLDDATPFIVAQAYSGAPVAANPAAPPDGAVPDAAAPSITNGVSGRGLIVYMSVAPDLEWTDLPAKPLMVPLMQELVREGIGRAHGSWWSIAGGRPAMPARSAELRPIDLQGRDDSEAAPFARDAGDARVIPVDDSGIAAAPLRQAGLWRAVDERGASRGIVAVNPDARGGRTTPQDAAALEQWLGRAAADGKVVWLEDDAPDGADPPSREAVSSLAELLARESPGLPISLPLLIAALVIAVFELWLARWASHAQSPVASIRRRGAAA